MSCTGATKEWTAGEGPKNLEGHRRDLIGRHAVISPPEQKFKFFMEIVILANGCEGGRRMRKKKELTTAEQMCQNLSEPLKSQAITLANAVLSMKHKIDKLIPEYDAAKVVQEITKTNGATEEKVNPLLVEFRALVKSYSSSLQELNEILKENTVPPETSPLSDIRSEFKICK